ncbi:cupin domain-containing protein [Heyndrickxia sp. FSL W8-0423]|uniref:cupin domain-containing protein n=1 Tax=Heyndrickxia sp. FSL W8-0423 TaxID=2921601 RepID=UPI0030F8067D
MIYNVYKSDLIYEVSHGGIGLLKKIRLDSNFETSIDFIDFVVVPPGSTIGRHRHQENEEVYFVIEGKGQMIINNVNYEVSTGDVIINPLYGEHELKNDSQNNMNLFIFQVSKSN